MSGLRVGILVVDNDRAFRDTLARVLGNNGWQVQTAASAAEAARHFKQRSFEAAIIDIDLGSGPDGIMLASQLRRMVPELGILMISGELENERRSRESGLGHFLKKPFKIKEVQAALAAIKIPAAGKGGT